jgi:hypothetical protein
LEIFAKSSKTKMSSFAMEVVTLFAFCELTFEGIN